MEGSGEAEVVRGGFTACFEYVRIDVTPQSERFPMRQYPTQLFQRTTPFVPFMIYVRDGI